MMMAAVVDLDLNCSPPRPPSPEAAAREELRQAMLRQEHTFRDQVRELHRLYWTQRNLMDEVLWKQSDDALYTRHSSHESLMMDLDEVENRDVFSDSDGLGKKADWEFDLVDVAADDDDDEFVEESLEVKGSIWRNPDVGYRNVIDLEKPATLDDEVEIVSSSGLSNLANQNGRFWDDSRCVSLGNCSHAVHGQLCREQATCHVSSGSIGSSDTPDSHSPVKPKTIGSTHMLIDLNIAQKDDFHVSPDPSHVFPSPSMSSSVVHPGDFWNNSSKIFQKEYESDMGSSKGSSITVLASVSAPDSSREVIAAGLFHDPQNQEPFSLQASEHKTEVRENIQHQHPVDDKVRGSSSQSRREISQEIFSIKSCGGSDSSSGLHKSGDKHVASQPRSVMHSECQEETLTVISDYEGEGIDLNASVGSTNLPSTIGSGSREKQAHDGGSEETVSSHSLAKNGSKQANPFEECPIVKDHQMAEKKDFKKALLPISVNTKIDKVQSPESGIAATKPVSIPETPEGRDYVCLRLRASNNEVSDPQDTVHRHPVERAETDGMVTMAAETLLSIFSDNSARIAASLGSSSQAEARDGTNEPQRSLDSFEESILNLEEIRDDGLSVPVRPPDKDGPSCGIKLKRGRGLRDFQREILPGLVSLARHEICDDLHAIGYELRKTRSRRACGDKWPAPTRMRQARRCSTAWNL